MSKNILTENDFHNATEYLNNIERGEPVLYYSTEKMKEYYDKHFPGYKKVKIRR